MARTKRSYESEIPDLLDLEGDDKDYSVLLAGADKERVEGAIAIQKYHVLRETQEHVDEVNAILRRSLGVPDD